MSDDMLLVVSRHDDRDPRPVRRIDVEVGMALMPEQPVQCEQHVAAGVEHNQDHDDAEDGFQGPHPACRVRGRGRRRSRQRQREPDTHPLATP